MPLVERIHWFPGKLFKIIMKNMSCRINVSREQFSSNLTTKSLVVCEQWKASVRRAVATDLLSGVGTIYRKRMVCFGMVCDWFICFI